MRSHFKRKPPQKKGQRPHAIVDRPFPYPPATAHDWASHAITRGFIDMPLNGFLAPPLGINILTRILRL